MNEYMLNKMRKASPNKKYFTYEEIYHILCRDYPEIISEIVRSL